MKHRVDGCIVLPRNVGGPLENELAPFARWLDGQGYSPSSSYQKVCLVSGFSLWLDTQHVSVQDITPGHLVRFLRHRSRRLAERSDNAFTLRQLLEYLRGTGAIGEEPVPTPRLPPIEHCLVDYERHLRDECALAPTTIVNYTVYVRALLQNRYARKSFRLEQLSAQDVVGFIQTHSVGMNRKRAKLMAAALRSFLRYLHCRGFLPNDLTGAIPSVAAWAMSSVPRAISATATEQLLASIDQRTAVGLRDYAIIVMFARLGLRLSEVMLLELDDIDWTAGSLHYRVKGSLRKQMPLPDEVGRALAGYLEHGRPRCTCRRVFLRHRAPMGGFRSPTGIDSVIRRCIQRAGLDTPSLGAHQFRHALATDLLHGGASLGEIGDLLGHRCTETTRIYTKVDIDSLRTLAAPWPGGVR